ncbi:NAD(P)-dependent oxidoreductase [Flavonifractor sp. An100]|uniref:NAD(P)-dependent oxidoreductase n=1 Tax=Flavonifractor sp. An100 TaxID=1965538 RepID=UPI000B3A7D27|nr:NAD(P)-dependent oxidoreductase [Flavonifractor sp. An100]OUQ76572.1 hypothetical protein B5E43_11590 [Flavonifractor sp. An100]
MKVFLRENIHPKALELLHSRAEILSDWEQLGQADAIITRNLKLPHSLLVQAPYLKVIAIHGTGGDGVDLDYCREQGITVLYVPYRNSDSVAELIVALTLSLLRRLPLADRKVIAGEIKQTAPAFLYGHELGGKVVGLVGVGDIARRAARIFGQGFGCSLIGYDPAFPHDLADPLGIQSCQTLEELMSKADIINVSVHLSPSTEHLINASRLALCKPEAILIHTARGGVVDEDALFHALKKGQLAGAACDVWQQEPPTPDHPLVGLDNVLATPHLGANTEEALERVGVRVVEELFTVLDGGRAEFTYTAPGEGGDPAHG